MSTQPQSSSVPDTLLSLRQIAAQCAGRDAALRSRWLLRAQTLQPHLSAQQLHVLETCVVASQHEPPKLRRPRLAMWLMQSAATHHEMLADLTTPTGIMHRAFATIDMDIKVYTMATEHDAELLTEFEQARAIAYGMMAVENGVDAMIMHAPNGATSSAVSIEQCHDLPTLAMVGACIAARYAHVPIIVDAAAAEVIIRLLHHWLPDIAGSIIVVAGHNVVTSVPCSRIDVDMARHPLMSFALAIQQIKILVAAAGGSI